MLKRAVYTSLLWSLAIITIGTTLIVFDIIQPQGYIPLLNPLALFVLTYLFYFAAVYIHLILMKKFNWNKWITASIGVFVIYLIIITPLILDDDYFKDLDWRVPFFLITQIVLLVFFDFLVAKIFIKKT
ncbi:hypothetical protein [Marinigracilibium pacificum]|uniref:Uncharacterized protein n=1 Tax=Marinigracilibium pacificum TaxID=2729599 RepID=A0A848ISU1_9BACT|nr:hypothetical protein [Marinigracilibium pacificum]NMM46846.1 hypothetical protein [Marinigracilibium pacificum]